MLLENSLTVDSVNYIEIYQSQQRKSFILQICEGISGKKLNSEWRWRVARSKNPSHASSINSYNVPELLGVEVSRRYLKATVPHQYIIGFDMLGNNKFSARTSHGNYSPFVLHLFFTKK